MPQCIKLQSSYKLSCLLSSLAADGDVGLHGISSYSLKQIGLIYLLHISGFQQLLKSDIVFV